MRENAYQARVIRRIEERLPGALVLKNDSDLRQGISDLLVLFCRRWGALEVKISEFSPVQPNQAYYIDLLNNMSYAAFIYPGNEAEILDELERALRDQ